MDEGQLIWIDISFPRGFMHQPPYRKVSHQQTIEFLADQVRGLAAQLEAGTPQVCFEFIQSGFNLPAFTIQGRQFRYWRCLRI